VRERQRDYELVFVISPLHFNDEATAAVIQRIQQSIEAEGGEIVVKSCNPPWGRRRLAYPIRAYAGGESSRRSFHEGFYVFFQFKLQAAKVIEVERTIKLSDAILRYLITVVEHKAKVVPAENLADFEELEAPIDAKDAEGLEEEAVEEPE